MIKTMECPINGKDLCSDTLFEGLFDNKRIETVEVDLQQMKVVQCYGACDKYTLYHDRIVNLVNGSMNTIKQYMNNNKQLAV